MGKLSRILVSFVALLILLSLSTFTVDQRQYALVFRLGEIVAVKSDPGLYFKTPIVYYYKVLASWAVDVSGNWYYLLDLIYFTQNVLRRESLAAEEEDAIRAYRQALLDVTEQSGFPHEVVWPTKPDVI